MTFRVGFRGFLELPVLGAARTGEKADFLGHGWSAARGTLTLIHASGNEEFIKAVALREDLITHARKQASAHRSEE